MAHYPGARVVAVEPVPENVQCLRRNLDGAAVVVPVCSGARPGKARMRTDASFGAFHVVLAGGSDGAGYRG